MIREVGYSKLIRPTLYILDLFIITLLSFFFLSEDIIDIASFVTFWFVLSISFSFYEVYRFTKIIKIVSLLIKQIILFTLVILSYLYIREIDIELKLVIRFFFLILVVLFFWCIFLFVISTILWFLQEENIIFLKMLLSQS